MAIILGTKIIEHDACFALFQDDKPLFVYEHERFNRIKHGFSYSIRSLEEGLKLHNLTLNDIDYVANYLDETLVEKRYQLFIDAYGKEHKELAESLGTNAVHMAKQYKHKIKSLGFPESKIYDIRHHVGHCSALFYPSEFEDAAILSIDGGGECETCLLAYGSGTNIEILKAVPYPYSMGHLYETVTRWLGWGFGEEGKTMALAAFGKPIYTQKLLDELVEIDDEGLFKFKQIFFGANEDILFAEMFGEKRKKDEPLSQHHKDVAASVQDILEIVMLRLAKTLKTITKSDNLLITGGVGLNSVANGKIVESGIFKNVQAFPQANDAGIAIGGAQFINYNILNHKRENHWQLEGAYLGKAVDEENVESLCKEFNIQCDFHENIEEVTAKLIGENNIVAWVQGKEEIGPRALGNRSIIANPLNAQMKDDINNRVKFREDWRPFAPSVLEEDSHLFFEIEQKMPYMIIVSKIVEEWREKLYSISHIDHTARVQTVNERQNKRYHTLLKAVKNEIGIGMVINTSYNVKGEPVVQTARQAVVDYLRTGIDYLVIGNYLITKDKNHDYNLNAFHPIETNIEVLSPCSHFTIIDEMIELAQFKEFEEALKKNSITYTLDKIETQEEENIVILMDVHIKMTRKIEKQEKYINLFKKFQNKKSVWLVDVRGEIINLEDIMFLFENK